MTRNPVYQRVLSSQFNKCAYCGDEMLLEYGKAKSVTLDHVVPKSRGGKDLVGTCYSCNQKKGAKPLMQFLKEDVFPNDHEKASTIFNSVASGLRRDRVLLHTDNTPRERVVLGPNTAYLYGRGIAGVRVRETNSPAQLSLFKAL